MLALVAQNPATERGQKRDGRAHRHIGVRSAPAFGFGREPRRRSTCGPSSLRLHVAQCRSSAIYAACSAALQSMTTSWDSAPNLTGTFRRARRTPQLARRTRARASADASSTSPTAPARHRARARRALGFLRPSSRSRATPMLCSQRLIMLTRAYGRSCKRKPVASPSPHATRSPIVGFILRCFPTIVPSEAIMSAVAYTVPDVCGSRSTTPITTSIPARRAASPSASVAPPSRARHACAA